VSPLTAGAGHLSAERPLDYRHVSVSERRRRWELRVYPAVRSTGRWLAVAIPVADVALVVAGVLDLWTGVLAGAVLELVLVLVVVAEARVFRRAYRGARADGLARLDAVRAGMRGVWPPSSSRSRRRRSASGSPWGGEFAGAGTCPRGSSRSPTAIASR
jgi:hypothetical protein